MVTYSDTPRPIFPAASIEMVTPEFDGFSVGIFSVGPGRLVWMGLDDSVIGLSKY